MRNENSTKRALLASILAFLLCVAMFVGSTFAWFTDTASTGVNKIQAGELDVALMMLEDGEWTDAEGGVLDFKAADGRTDILWEPGATYEIPALKVVNNGNLALKYQLLISGLVGDTELADVLDVWVKVDDGEWNKNVGTLSALMAEEDGAAYGIILPEGEAIDATASAAEQAITAIGATDSYTIALHMQEEAGNEYQNLAIEGMSVTVYATQYTYEYDMFDNQYDKDAAYDKSEEEAPVDPIPDGAVTIATVDELIAFANSDATHAVLIADIDVTESVLITRSVTLDLGEYTISGDSDNAVLRVYAPEGDSQINVVINATTGGVVNNGTGYAIYSGEDIEEGNDTEETNLTINGGTYMTNGEDCIRQILGTCTINGGSYQSSYGRTVLNGQRWYGSEFVINDGTFYGFNPACVSVWTGFDGSDYSNFYHQHDIIASGKTVEYSDGWYTVVDGTFTPKASTKSLCYLSVGIAIQEIVEMNDVTNLGTITLLANDTLTAADAELAINNQFSFVLDGYTLTLPTGYTTYETVISSATVTKIKRDVA